jgi:hypothetical protein
MISVQITQTNAFIMLYESLLEEQSMRPIANDQNSKFQIRPAKTVRIFAPRYAASHSDVPALSGSIE